MQKQALIRHLLIITCYFLIAMIIVGRNPMTLLDNFIGSETGDTYEMARNVWYFTHAVRNGEPMFYQTMLGYPDGIDGSILLTVPLQYFPMWFLALFLPLQIAYNFVVLLWIALNGWSMYWLARYLLHDEQEHIPALLAGLVYMAYPLFQGHLAEGHAGLLVAWSPPLYLWALFRLTSTENNHWRWMLTSILFFYLSTSGHILQSIYVLIPLTGTFLLAKIYQRDWQASLRVIAMGLLASVIVLIVLFPAIRTASSEAAYSDAGGYVRYSADLLAVVSPSFFHPVFDAILTYPHRVLGTNWAEGSAYIGLLVAILMIIALIKQRESRWWLLLAVIAWLLSLGPVLKIFDQPVVLTLGDYQTNIPLPFSLIQHLPGFSLARAPARFDFTLAIAVAVMAGYGAARLWNIRHDKWKYGLAALLALGILAEYQVFWPQPLRQSAVPQAVAELRDDQSIRAVFNIPYQHALAAKEALYLQSAHQHPLIAGQITRTTPVNPVKLAVLQTTLDPFLLHEAGADVVILHRARAAEIDLLEVLEAQANLQLGDPIYQDERIAIYRVPNPPTNSDEIALSYEITEQNIDFQDGIRLVATWSGVWDETLYIWLRWQFDAPRSANDIRFVHVIDDNGEIALQSDVPLGSIAADEQRMDFLQFPLDGLTPGAYTIRAGWYNLQGDLLSNYLTEDDQGDTIMASFMLP